ncbi:MAG TPA: hypothetical protein VIL37_17900 [Natronosporangium sp.]
MDFLIVLFISITIIACSGMLLGFVEGRRKYKLELHREERRRIEARTKELEAQNKRLELDYQRALLEIEQFDRRDSTALASRPKPTDQR